MAPASGIVATSTRLPGCLLTPLIGQTGAIKVAENSSGSVRVRARGMVTASTTTCGRKLRRPAWDLARRYQSKPTRGPTPRTSRWLAGRQCSTRFHLGFRQAQGSTHVASPQPLSKEGDKRLQELRSAHDFVAPVNSCRISAWHALEPPFAVRVSVTASSGPYPVKIDVRLMGTMCANASSIDASIVACTVATVDGIEISFIFSMLSQGFAAFMKAALR
jgi:hypothetical protein